MVAYFPFSALNINSKGVAWALDGFFYLSDGRLFSVKRGGAVTPHLPKLDNLMTVSSGPARSLLLKEGDNRLGDLGKLYFPDEETCIRIEPEWFPDEDPDDIRALFCVADCQRLVAATTERFWSVPMAIALRNPRYHASSGATRQR